MMFIAKETTELTNSKDLSVPFRLVKVADIVYTTLVCCLVVLFTLTLLQKSIFKWIEQLLNSISSTAITNTNRAIVLFLFIFLFSLFAVLAYILRNLIEKIPSPFNGMQGLNHRKLSEISDMSNLVLIILIVQTPMYNKLMNILMNEAPGAHST